ncbi:MAG: radical SAM protein [Candidatus Diapherotrites archaeon]
MRSVQEFSEKFLNQYIREEETAQGAEDPSIDDDAYLDTFFPFQITWFINLNCNLRCPYCFLPEKSVSFEKPENEQIQKIALALKKHEIFSVDILGGEPFLESGKTVLAVQELKKNGISVRSISTNGTIFDEALVNELKKNPYHVLQVSVDAPDPSTYEKVRAGKNFEKIAENIERFVKSGLNVYLGFVITKDNFEKIGEFFDFCEKLRVKGVSFGGFVPVGRGAGIKEKQLSAEEAAKVYRKIKNRKTFLKVLMQSDISDGGCSGGMAYAVMMPNGDLYPCAMLIWCERLKIGNILEEKMSKENNAFFRKVNAFKFTSKCKDCSYPPICSKACKALLLQNYDSLDFQQKSGCPDED